MISECMNAD